MDPIIEIMRAKCKPLNYKQEFPKTYEEQRLNSQETPKVAISGTPNQVAINKPCPSLVEIVMNCVALLTQNIMQSSITTPVSEMVDKITNYLTENEKLQSKQTIDAIFSTLEDYGWTGSDFISAPDRQGLYAQLLTTINQ